MSTDTIIEMKSCSTCGVGRALGRLHRVSTARGGRRPDCKDCRCRAHREQRALYRSANLSAGAERQRLREANRKDAFVEHVDRLIVFQRDEGICGICNKEANVDDFHLDHIVPLSKGGAHSYDNVQVAHPVCNSMKGARLDFVLQTSGEVN